MATDDPFANVPGPLEESEDDTTPEAEPVAEPTTPPPAPAGFSAEDMAKAVAEATAPLKDAIAALNQQVAASNAPAEPQVPDDDEFGQRFYKAPRTAIQEEFDRASGPLVGQLADQIAEANLMAQAQRVNRAWGDGAFEAHIEPELRGIVDEAKKSNPTGLLNRTAFVNAVDTVVGRKAKELVEYSQTSSKDHESATLQEVAKLKESILAEVEPNLSGGIRRNTTTGATLSEEQKQYIKDMFKADGVKRDERTLAALQATPVRNIEEYRALRETLKKEAKK